MPLRVGVIGVGTMGKHHVRVISQMKEMELIGIVDINEAVAETAKEFNVDFSPNRQDLLKKCPELVIVAVPTSAHYEVGMDCLSTGAHLLIEKPITNSLEYAEELVNYARGRGLKLFVGHVERFNPVVRLVKEMIDSGDFGKVQSIANLRVGRYRKGGGDTGIILDLGTHDIDIISYLYGMRAETVFAVASSRDEVTEDSASITLRFSNSAVGYIELSWLTPYKVRKMFITSSQHFGLVDLIEQKLIIYDGEGWARTIENEKEEPLRLELESAVRAIKEDLPPEVSGEDSIYNLKVAFSARKSATAKQAINLTEFHQNTFYPTRTSESLSE